MKATALLSDIQKQHIQANLQVSKSPSGCISLISFRYIQEYIKYPGSFEYEVIKRLDTPVCPFLKRSRALLNDFVQLPEAVVESAGTLPGRTNQFQYSI